MKLSTTPIFTDKPKWLNCKSQLVVLTDTMKSEFKTLSIYIKCKVFGRKSQDEMWRGIFFGMNLCNSLLHSLLQCIRAMQQNKLLPVVNHVEFELNQKQYYNFCHATA